MPPPSQIACEAAGTARRIQGGPDGQTFHDAVHEGLVQIEQAVRGVVMRRPPLVSVVDQPASRLNTGMGSQLRVVEQPPHLVEAAAGELLVEVTGPAPQQGQALQPEQVGQRVLVDRLAHRCSVPRARPVIFGSY